MEAVTMFVCVWETRLWRRMLCAPIGLFLGFAALTCPAKSRADTPAQTQKAIQAICDRASASVARRDLAGFMAMYAPDFTLKNVVGRKSNYRQLQASMADVFARDDYHEAGHCTVSQVVPLGNQARALLHWHFTDRHARSASAPAYTYARDYVEESVWKKRPDGWHETSAQMTHDTIDHQR